MKHWLRRPLYLVTILMVALWIAWLVAAPYLYRDGEIDTLGKLACEVAGIGCVFPEEAENSLILQEKRISEELDTLKVGAEGQMVIDRLESLRQIRSDIDRKEEHFPIRSLLVLIFGVLFELALAGIATYWVGYKGLRRLKQKGLLDRDKLIGEIDQALHNSDEWPREAIVKVLVEEEDDQRKREIENFSSTDIKGRKVNWPNISKLLFNTAVICLDKLGPGSYEEKAVNHQYYRVRKLIRQEIGYSITAWFILSVVFALVYYGLTLIAASSFPEGLRTDMLDWLESPGWLIFSLIVPTIAYRIIPFGVKWLTEKTRTELDDILATGLGALIAFIIAAFGIFKALNTIPPYFQYAVSKGWRIATADGLPFFLTIIIGTWVLIFVFNRFIIYLLEQWAATTKQKSDDTLVKMFQVFGTFFVVAGAGAIFAIKFQTQISEVAGIESVLLPYSIFVGVVTAILGYASREVVENLFASFLLQIDKPFDIGDRLVMETGEVCDVREVGMRGTKLYNVLENVEISVPNRIMASQKITDISRPDLQLRIPITVMIPHDGSTVETAEGVLLDVAYEEEEVDQARVAKDEISDQLHLLRRRSIEEHVASLLQTYPKIKMVYSERILGQGGYDSVQVFPALNDRMEEIKKLRRQYGTLTEKRKADFSAAMAQAGLVPSNVLLSQSQLRNLASIITSTKEDSESNSIAEKTLLQELAWEAQMDEKQYRKSVSKVILELVDPISAGLKDAELHELLRALSHWLASYDRKCYAVLKEIATKFGEMGEYLYAIRDVYRHLRESTQELVSELSKEPLVHSEFRITEDGRAYAHITLRVFATHLERRFEVVHKLNKQIQARLMQEGIKLLSIAGGYE